MFFHTLVSGNGKTMDIGEGGGGGGGGNANDRGCTLPVYLLIPSVVMT